MKLIKCFILISFILLSSNFNLYSGVTIKNGNFWMNYVDNIIGNKDNFKIKRTYNSVSSETTIFGLGWATSLGTKLEFMPDGSINLLQGGAGSQLKFYNVQQRDNLLLTKSIDTLTNIALINKYITNTPYDILSFKTKLFNNQTYLYNVYNKFKNNKWFKIKYFEIGIYESNSATEAKRLEVFKDTTSIIDKIKTCQCDGNKRTRECFNSKGLLTKYYETYNDYITESDLLYTLEYKDNDDIDFIIVDNDTTYFKFTNNVITEINSKKFINNYEYDSNKLLIKAAICKLSDARIDTSLYIYEYDANFNMIAIKYKDGTKMTMEYSPKPFRIASIINRDSSKIVYPKTVYYNLDGSIDENHYKVDVIKIQKSDTIYHNYYEYYLKDINKNSIIYKTISNENNSKTISIYTDFSKMDTLILNNDTALFIYNNKNLLVKKKSKLHDYLQEYYQSGKLKEIIKIKKITNDTIVRKYKYNDEGALLETTENNLIYKINYATNVIYVSNDSTKLILKFLFGDRKYPSNVIFSNGDELQLDYENDKLECKYNINGDLNTNRLYDIFNKFWINTKAIILDEKID